MDRTIAKEWNCYLINGIDEYYYSSYNNLGHPVVQLNADPTPLVNNPSNIKEMQLSFATNKNYFSGVRSLLMNFTFIGDGADILRYVKYGSRGYAADIFFMIERFNPYSNIFEKYYYGRLDMAQTKDVVSGYSVPCIDTSAWGILSQNDDVKYPIDCNPSNPRTIPVVFDGITLRAKYTYQPVGVQFRVNKIAGVVQPFAIVLINTDGDSAGIITNNQTYTFQDDGVPAGTIPDININYLIKTSRQINIKISGSFTFKLALDGLESENLVIGLAAISNLGTAWIDFGSLSFFQDYHLNDVLHTISFNRALLLAEGESLTMAIRVIDGDVPKDWLITPSVLNFTISTDTQSDATIVYARRPLDVLRDVVGRATKNKYVVNSNYFESNHNLVITCGDALRQSPNSQIKTSFRDWFKAYDVEKWIAFRIDKKAIWVEPVIDIYDPLTSLFDVGEVKDVEIEDAFEYLCNEVELNMNKQDYRHPSGRLEFNGLNTFSIVQFNIKNKLSLVSPYRKDSYGMEFIRMDYQQQSTEDNSGDDTVFMVDITDEIISVETYVNNFLNIEVNNQPLSPIIYYPFINDIIDNNKPVVRGVCQPSTNFNVYVDGILDGVGTSDINGIYAYDIQTSLSKQDEFNDGVHVIELGFSDLTGTTSSVAVVIMDEPVPPSFENIHDGDTIYNNSPQLTGFLKTGQSATLVINGVDQAVKVGDGNCRWSHFTPLQNGTNTITLGSASVTINVFPFVETPLICSLEFFQGFNPIQDNLPIIRGVAKPDTVVNVYLDYYEGKPIGTATSDSSGRWSIQVVPLLKLDGTVLTPIPNGNHIISTSLFIDAVPVTISGYKINRPDYDNIEGVLDNTVFNTELTPKHNLLNRMIYWKSIFAQQHGTIIKFETADKNRAFSTTLGGVTVKEAEDVKLSDHSHPSLFYPYIFNCVVQTPFFFADIIEDFSSGGLVKFTYQGLDIFCLPIGKMSVEDVSRDISKWSLLVSADTSLGDLMRLSNPGLTLKVMADSIYRSDYNTLHFVRYDNQSEAPELYDDWFKNRNEQWANNPQYVQKLQTNDVLVDQIIVSFDTPKEINLAVFDSCGVFITSYLYQDISPSPVSPEVVKEAIVDLAALGKGDYYFLMIIPGVGSFSSSTLEIGTQGNTSLNRYFFTLKGVPIAGDIVHFMYIIDLNETDFETFNIYSTVQAGWSLTDLINDLYNKAFANNPNVDFYTDVDGNDGLRVTGFMSATGFAEATQAPPIVTPAQNYVIAISEFVSVKNRHYGTILINGGSPKNKINTVFSNGFRSVIRVEGLVEKWIGSIETLINEDETGNFNDLRSIATKKRTVLFGDGKGIPDWLYLKICSTILLEDLFIQGVGYVISKDARVEPVDRIAGYPMYYYSIDFTMKDNVFGHNFTDFKPIPPFPDLFFDAFWAWNSSPFTPANLPGFTFQGIGNFSLGANILADYEDAADGDYVAMKYPVSQGVKTNWFNTSFNYGTIGPPDQVFVIYSDGIFNYVYSKVRAWLPSANKKILYS